jgi:hypothetical protein
MIAIMLLVFLFGLAGISVAYTNVHFNDHIWVPITLVVLSGFMIMSIIIQLIRHHAPR